MNLYENINTNLKDSETMSGCSIKESYNRYADGVEFEYYKDKSAEICAAIEQYFEGAGFRTYELHGYTKLFPYESRFTVEIADGDLGQYVYVILSEYDFSFKAIQFYYEHAHINTLKELNALKKLMTLAMKFNKSELLLNAIKDSKSKLESSVKNTEQSLKEEDTDKYTKFKEFADNIDLTPLYDKLKQMSGIPNIEFTSKVIERPGDVYIDIKSNNLIDACGLFKLALIDCHMETFNSGIVTSKETGEPYWWGTMDLRYQTKQGGSNGVRFLRFSYNEEPNKWMFNEEG